MSNSCDEQNGQHQEALTADDAPTHSEDGDGFVIQPSSQDTSLHGNDNVNEHEDDRGRDLSATNPDNSNRVGEDEDGGSDGDESDDGNDAGEHNISISFLRESNGGRGDEIIPLSSRSSFGGGDDNDTDRRHTTVYSESMADASDEIVPEYNDSASGGDDDNKTDQRQNTVRFTQSIIDRNDEITPEFDEPTFRTTMSVDSKWTTLLEASARVDPVARQRARDERELATMRMTRENVLEMSQKIIKVRRVRQYERLRKALCSASNSLDSRKMVGHIQKKVVTPEALREKPQLQHLADEMVASAGRLYKAVDDNDRKQIRQIQMTLDDIMLQHDRDYLEEMQREKFRFRRAVIQNKAPHPPPKWAQDPTYRFLSMFKGDFTGEKRRVTVREQRWYVSRGAWLLAITFLVVAITFVILDFHTSMMNMAISTEIVQHDTLPLPVVYACMTLGQIPMFSMQRLKHKQDPSNNEFRGYPLWGLRSYTHHETGETYKFPRTHEVVAEEVNIGNNLTKCNETLAYMSYSNIRRAIGRMTDFDRCFTCLRIGNRKQVWLNYSNAIKRPPGAITLEFGISRSLDYCFHRGGMWNTWNSRNMLNQLLDNRDRLLAVKAIEMIDVDDIDFVLNHGLEAIERLGDEFLFARTRASILCNLYFLSGALYPVPPEAKVRYSFNLSAGRDAWVRLDDDFKYLSIRSSIPLGLSNIGVANSTSYMHELMNIKEKDHYQAETGITLRIFTVENASTGQPGVGDFTTILHDGFRDLLLYSKKIEENVPSYLSSVQHGGRIQFLALSSYRRMNISLDFATFDVEHSVKVPTTTLVEFLTDLFEYIGLFTGICAYSLLVSPARMYLRRRQNLKRKARLVQRNINNQFGGGHN